MPFWLKHATCTHLCTNQLNSLSLFPPGGEGLEIVGELTLLNKVIVQGSIELLTITEPPPQHVGANVGDLTCM